MKHRTRALTRWSKHCVEKGQCIARSESIDRQKGRKEIRILELFEPSSQLRQNYSSISRVIALRRIRIVQGQTSDKTHYYISSLKSNEAALFQHLIRSHWAVENKFHWVKDVIMKEDATKFHDYKTFKMNALYRNYVFSCIKLNGYKSIKYALESLRTKPTKIIKLIRT